MTDARPPVYQTTMGDGPRDVLAIHCTLAHSGVWRGLLREMPDDITIHAIDLPSHGRSADWKASDGDFQDVSAAGARALFDRPMDLLGHSFGATIALRLAAERPDLVRSLTLIEPVFFAVAALDAPEALEKHNADAQPFFDLYAAGDITQAARLFNRMWADPTSPRWPDLPEATRAAMVRAIHVVVASDAAIFHDRMGLLKPGGMSQLTAPTRLMRGSNTHEVIGVINDGLARRMPNAESHVVEGAGHMLPITHPAETAAHLRALFAQAPLPA
ncbi:alpha/beta fold hydrolase [Aestuariivita boseongensis]|uniref:alpha/beta fold hydrolase n=1 Tax=Aestuariivita boseongensis TaxID=1470562 RepID=UPI000681AB6D|nr:alpha/beta hydrolase [Aestuariivita boseongensis]